MGDDNNMFENGPFEKQPQPEYNQPGGHRSQDMAHSKIITRSKITKTTIIPSLVQGLG